MLVPFDPILLSHGLWAVSYESNFSVKDRRCRYTWLQFGSRLLSHEDPVAPEIILGHPYSEKIDVFSFSILAFELMSNNYSPYGTDLDDFVQFRVANDPTFRPDLDLLDEKAPTWLQRIVVQCWAHSESDRPSFSEIVGSLIDGRRSMEAAIAIYVRLVDETDEIAEDVTLEEKTMEGLREIGKAKWSVIDGDAMISVANSVEGTLTPLLLDEHVARLSSDAMVVFTPSSASERKKKKRLRDDPETLEFLPKKLDLGDVQHEEPLTELEAAQLEIRNLKKALKAATNRQ